MIDEDGLPSVLANQSGLGFVVAPAGYGKTHLIATSVKHANGRQLILTHTCSGVDSLRKKIYKLGVDSALFQVETISSWVLRMCLAYPAASHWTNARPEKSDEWDGLNEACAILLNTVFFKSVLRASYSGMYVDEYQDCSPKHHAIILLMGVIIPCRILGDPLQSIFNFPKKPTIDWKNDVEATFSRMGALEKPWRWILGNQPALGEWINDRRIELTKKNMISLSPLVLSGEKIVEIILSSSFDLIKNQQKVLESTSFGRANVVAVMSGKRRDAANRIAKGSNGVFCSIEEMEGATLRSFLRKIDCGPAIRKIDHLNDFFEDCFVNGKSIIFDEEYGVSEYDERREKTSTLVDALKDNFDSANILALLLDVSTRQDMIAYREDLFFRCLDVFLNHMKGKTSYMDGYLSHQTQIRRDGRTITNNRTISTTLLIKGLEYDISIVMDAASLSREEMYVAITRAQKKLIIITTQLNFFYA